MTEHEKDAVRFPGQAVGPFQRWLNRRSLKEALLLGILVPILIAFLIIAVLLFINVGPLVSIQDLGILNNEEDQSA